MARPLPVLLRLLKAELRAEGVRLTRELIRKYREVKREKAGK